MKKPIIGLTPSVDEENNRCLVQPGYLESIDRAGGLGIMLPLTDREEDIKQFVQMCDGFLFVGGPDIEPWRYGQELLPECGPQNIRRDALEWKLMEAALAADKPVLGVCRGIQVLNTVLGGTLYQDIPSQCGGAVEHDQPKPYDRASHSLSIAEGSPLHRLLGESSIQVNSLHHQAVKELSMYMEAMACSEDGLVEAAYMPGQRFVWAVQWHPEFLPEEPESRKLFRAFVNACKFRDVYEA